MSNNIIESILGAFVLIVAGWFLVFAYDRSDVGGNGYELTARFDKADGLGVGSDVRMAGIKIGSITDQKLDPVSFQAIISLKINNGIDLPLDTAAAITSESLLGGNYITLIPGGYDETLMPGDEITETQDSVDLLGLLTKFIYNDDNANEK